MASVCDITGKKTQFGHNVSHSNRRTKRTFKPNLQDRNLHSEILGRTVQMSISTRAIRTLDKYNGLDGFMINVKNRRVIEDFSDFAKQIRKEIIAKVGPEALPGKNRKSPTRSKPAAE